MVEDETGPHGPGWKAIPRTGFSLYTNPHFPGRKPGRIHVPLPDGMTPTTIQRALRNATEDDPFQVVTDRIVNYLSSGDIATPHSVLSVGIDPSFQKDLRRYIAMLNRLKNSGITVTEGKDTNTQEVAFYLLTGNPVGQGRRTAVYAYLAQPEGPGMPMQGVSAVRFTHIRDK